MEQKEVKDLKTLRVLMAEDDEVNQLVAKIIFKQIGCSYDIVENGVLAFEKIKNSIYDVVLMDIEMPEMDGYQTTEKIRTELQDPLSRIPIIAITAHISDTELKKCIDVGMNGSVFKPLKLANLVEKLNSIFNGTNEEILEKKNKADDPKTFNLKSLYASCSNNQTIVNNVIKLFMQQTPINLLQLQELLEKNDWENLKNLCHKMKSVFALIGAETIKQYLNDIEVDCSKNNINVTKFDSSIKTIQNLGHSLLAELKSSIDINN